jgi:hypothetical protein
MLSINKQLYSEFLKPIKIYKIASKSEKGLMHIVEELPNGKFVCDCAAGSFKSECRHIREVKHKKLGIIKSNYEQRKNN